ncbi:MAG: hypothetical protein WCO42_02680 [bacterium]
MTALLQNEILDFLKQRLLPEIGEIRKDLDAFRVQTQADFKVINGRLDEMDKRFEQMDKRFEQVDKRFEQVDKRFEQVDKRLEQLDKRMDMMTFEMHELKGEMREVRSYAFTTRMSETHYAVRDKPRPKS